MTVKTRLLIIHRTCLFSASNLWYYFNCCLTKFKEDKTLREREREKKRRKCFFKFQMLHIMRKSIRQWNKFRRNYCKIHFSFILSSHLIFLHWIQFKMHTKFFLSNRKSRKYQILKGEDHRSDMDDATPVSYFELVGEDSIFKIAHPIYLWNFLLFFFFSFDMPRHGTLF